MSKMMVALPTICFDYCCGFCLFFYKQLHVFSQLAVVGEAHQKIFIVNFPFIVFQWMVVN